METFFIISLALLLVTSYAAVTDVTIYTKDASPFVENKAGFSIDLIQHIILEEAYSSLTTSDITIKDVFSNDAMLTAVSNNASTGNTLFIGVAATTITAEREEIVDFLPRYPLNYLPIL